MPSVYPSDTTNDCIFSPDAYARYCGGFSAGFGGEISLIVLFATNMINRNLLGNSFLIDVDAGLGLAFGFGFGVYIDGEQTNDPNNPCYYELTFGGGFGVEFFGTSFCNTSPVCAV